MLDEHDRGFNSSKLEKDYLRNKLLAVPFVKAVFI